MTNAWDFYKPNLASEYVRPFPPSSELSALLELFLIADICFITFLPFLQPIVDGPLSVTSYVHAVDKAYESYRTKYEKKYGTSKVNGVNGTNGTNGTNGSSSQSHGITAASFDYVLFHS